MEFKVADNSRFTRKESPLKNKKVVFLGDSITAASTYDYKDCLNYGFAGRCSAMSGCFYINLGRDGASLGTCRNENRVLAQLEKAKNLDADLIVLHGGANDAWDSAPAGSITNSFELSDFDISTCAGGLEELFYHAKEYFGEKKLCFIINHAMPSSDIGSLAHFEPYYHELIRGCEKWDIPYIDLFRDEEFSKEFKVTEKVNTADYIHPTGTGYDILAKKILPFLESLF